MDNHEISKYKGPIYVTTLYFVMFYCFLYGQSFVPHYLYYIAKRESKLKAKKTGEKEERVSFAKIKYDSKNRMSLIAERTVGNTMEQMIPFLTSFWLYSIFVSSETATFFGYAYIATRSYYPLAFYMGTPWILFSTVPGYATIVYLLASVVYYAVHAS